MDTVTAVAGGIAVFLIVAVGAVAIVASILWEVFKE